MAAPTYGAYQPGAVDPWPIESVVAKEAITSPADAQRMLSSYEQQRQAQGYIYGQEADRQHDFAKQQLLAQMQEARNKLIPELVGKPGGGAFLAGGGIQGVGPGDGGNAAAWAGLGQAGQQHDFAQNYDLEGKGTEAFSRAGQDVALQQIPGLQNFQTTGAGEHSDITVERLKVAQQQAQAAAKAARGARAEKDPKVHYTMYGPATDAGQPNNATLSLPSNTPPEVFQRHRDNITRNLGIANPSGGNAFGATSLGQSPPATPPPAASASATPAPQGRSRTSLPPAGGGSATPAPQSTARGSPPPFITDPVLQNRAKEMYKLLPPAAQQQVWANRPSGVNMPITHAPDGKIVFVGRDGKAYSP